MCQIKLVPQNIIIFPFSTLLSQVLTYVALLCLSFVWIMKEPLDFDYFMIKIFPHEEMNGGERTYPI